MKKFYSLITFLFVVIAAAHSQDDCYTDINQRSLMENNATYRASVTAAAKRVQDFLANHRDKLKTVADTIYTFPVVFQVLHVGEPIGTGTNISLATAQTAINNLNGRFANTIGNGLDVGIRFCLAVRDPQNCPTDGVNRIDASSDSAYVANGICSANQESLQDMGNWPKEDYINIWVVRALCNNGGGATTTYQFSEYGGITSTALALTGTTLAHEMGHLFGLAHSFAGGETGNCPVDTNCAVNGDGVCDTPPHRQSDCGATEPCSSTGLWDNSRYNYMSYCGTKDRFTQGQKDKMRALIYSTPFLKMATESISCDTMLHATYTKANVVSCHGDCNGSVTAVPLACSTQSFHYLWNTGQTTQTITGLCTGTYTCTITDANNSSSTSTITATITDPTALSVSVAADTNACNYGTATATISGGTSFDCGTSFPIMLGNLSYGVNLSTQFPAPYGNYDKSGSSRLYFAASELHAMGFPKGNIYSAALNIYQNAGATIYDNWEVKIDSVDPPTVTVYGPQTINTTLGWNTYNFNTPFDWNGVSNIYLKFCFANSSATVNANVWYNNIGGTSYQRSNTENVCTDPPSTTWGTGKRATTQFNVCRDTSYYSILWSNGQTTTTATGLLAGNYSVTVTDSHGCTKVQNVTVPSTATVMLAGGILSTTCPTSGCSYQWYKNGTPVCSNAPTCAYTGPGNYTVMITDGAGCIFSGSYVVVGIDEPDASGLFSIHPNPASETFTITFNRPLSGKINIYTILGDNVYSKDFNGMTENISSRHFSPGVYFVKVSNAEKMYAQKLIIE